MTKDRSVEEPCAGNLASTVLKTSGENDLLAEFDRALKRPILQRKNAYFYRTAHGAAIGDLWASVLETCRLNGIPEFAYLVALGRAGRAVRAAPRDWLPWIWAERQRAAAA